MCGFKRDRTQVSLIGKAPQDDGPALNETDNNAMPKPLLHTQHQAPARISPDALPSGQTGSLARIVLCTLNARYTHASLGLRYLLANMGGLRSATQLLELTISRPVPLLLQDLLAAVGPAHSGGTGTTIVGFGVYIWNVVPTLALVQALRLARPDIKIVLGGPEVSHELDQQAIVAAADFVITGWGDVSFPKLCQALVYGPQPLMKVIAGEQPPLDEIALPYDDYTDEDIAHRLIYVEASRGCPFKCEFCLSSLDKTAWAFDQDKFLAEISRLYARGVRQFKFVDRTFNLKIEASARILQFFLDCLAAQATTPSTAATAQLFVHFELIPDQLPDRLKALIAQFPPGVLQFEIGIQSFNPEVQQRISRRQDHAKTLANIGWLVNHSHAHLHTDLIFGLPGESLASFADGFDTLYALRPHEIQLGILKRLRGTPIARHTLEHGMVYDPQPPYTVLQTGVVSALEMAQFTRLARYWDMLANSGRFQHTMALVMGDVQEGSHSAFWRFWHLSEALFNALGKTHGITPEQLVDALFECLLVKGDALGLGLGLSADTLRQALLVDYLASGAKAKPMTLAHLLTRRHLQAYADAARAKSNVSNLEALVDTPVKHLPISTGKRQQQHLQSAGVDLADTSVVGN